MIITPSNPMEIAAVVADVYVFFDHCLPNLQAARPAAADGWFYEGDDPV